MADQRKPRRPRRSVTDALPSDDELIQLSRGGDRTAFRLLVQRNDLTLYRIARSVVPNDEEAEDVVQETYFRAFLHLGDFRGDGSLSTWLYRIALNEAMRRGRQRSRLDDESLEARAESEKESYRVSMTGLDPERAAAHKEVRQIVERAIDGLPETYRTVVVMRDIEELSVRETASLLGIREEAVKTRLHRARRVLRQLLTEELASALKDAFPFAGERCDLMIEALWNRLLSASAVKPPDVAS